MELDGPRSGHGPLADRGALAADRGWVELFADWISYFAQPRDSRLFSREPPGGCRTSAFVVEPGAAWTGHRQNGGRRGCRLAKLVQPARRAFEPGQAGAAGSRLVPLENLPLDLPQN